MGKAKTAEEKAAAKAAKEAKKNGSVTVEFEGGQSRVYSGPDAEANAKEFVSKRPNDRRIV